METWLKTLNQQWASLGGVAGSTLRILIILLAAWIITRIVRRAILAFRERITSRFDDRESIKRAETLTQVFRYVAAVVVWLISGMLVLGEVGISVAPILGAAGVVGLAVGFGAQSLVKDYFTGLFILLENQICEGDVVKVGDHAGLVEVVTLRYVQLRDFDGSVHFVPNSTITTVINMSRGFAQAAMEIGVAYRENVDDVMAVMREVGAALKSDAQFGPKILGDLEVLGVERWDDSAVILRCRFKCVALEQWNVRREYLRRLKQAFDERGIEIPFPHITVYAGEGKNGQAPALPIRLVRAVKPTQAAGDLTG